MRIFFATAKRDLSWIPSFLGREKKTVHPEEGSQAGKVVRDQEKLFDVPRRKVLPETGSKDFLFS